MSSPNLLDELEATVGVQVYRQLLLLLCHLDFAADEAKEHWLRVVDRCRDMGQRLGEPVDVRVALVSYFVEVRKLLRNPIVMELQFFQETEALAQRDGLTGLFNYRHLISELTREVRRAERYGNGLSLVMVDLDDFKAYNDTFGHQAGNDALVQVARTLTTALRDTDCIARYGGEEFALMLPSTSKVNAYAVAERLRMELHQQSAAPDALCRRPLHASFGVSAVPADALSVEDLVRRADEALYAAKARGKNCVALAGDDRRSHRRVAFALAGTYRLVDSQPRSLATIDVSEGGLLCRLEDDLPVGALLEVHLKLPAADAPLSAMARVVRHLRCPDETTEAALRFVELRGPSHHALSVWLQSQRNGTVVEF